MWKCFQLGEVPAWNASILKLLAAHVYCFFLPPPPLQCFLLSRARLLLNLCSRFLASCNFFTLADIGWLLHSSLSLLGSLILLLCWLLHETTRTLCWENCMGAVDFQGSDVVYLNIGKQIWCTSSEGYCPLTNTISSLVSSFKRWNEFKIKNVFAYLHAPPF